MMRLLSLVLGILISGLLTIGSARAQTLNQDAEESGFGGIFDVVTPGHDDGSVVEAFMRGSNQPAKRSSDDRLCPPGDLTCEKIEAGLRSFSLPPVQIGGGVRYGSGAADVALRLSMSITAVDRPQGMLKVIPFDMVYLPDAGGFRIRIGLLEGDALFFCNKITGDRSAPVQSLFDVCVDAEERIGYGGTLLQFQHDFVGEESRWVARWMAIQLTYAILANGSDASYLKQRLNAHIGSTLDTSMGGPDRGTFLRMNVGISGLIRTDDLRWEANGYAAYRPNVTSWDDYGVEARVQILRHLMLKSAPSGGGLSLPSAVGIEARYDGWTRPGRSFSLTGSTSQVDSWYLGLIFKVSLQ